MPIRRLVLTALLIIALPAGSALSACSTATPHPSTGLGAVHGSPSAPGSASASGAASPTPTTTSTTSTPKPPTYPKTAQGYTQAALDAYVKGNDTRLGLLSNIGAKINFDNIHPTNSHWHYHTCEGAAGSSYCTFDNDNGDRVQMQVDNATLGKPHAIVDVVLDATEYGASADGVVNTFMQAWHDGNVYRMKILSSAAVTSYFTHYTPQESWTLADDSGAGHTHVRITNSDGFDQTVDVTNSKIGSAHSIGAVCNPTCA